MGNYILLLGRILYSLPLIVMGSFHFLDYTPMTGYAAASGVPLPGVSVIVSGLVLIIGSVMILVGLRGKIGAWLVTVFLIATAIMIHQFWAIPEPQVEMSNFMKNIIMAGAALMLTQTGTGPYSVDNLNK